MMVLGLPKIVLLLKKVVNPLVIPGDSAPLLLSSCQVAGGPGES